MTVEPSFFYPGGVSQALVVVRYDGQCSQGYR